MSDESEDQDESGNDDPEAVKLMIDFLYLHDYEAPTVEITQAGSERGADDTFGESSAETNTVKLYPTYGSRRGKMKARQVRKSSLAATPPSITPLGDCNTVAHAKIYALATKYNIESLKTTALREFDQAATYAWNHAEFAEAIHVVYTTTAEEDAGLRDIVVQTIQDHKHDLAVKPAIETAIRSHDSLTYALWSRVPAQGRFQGPSCCKCGVARVATCHGNSSGTYSVCRASWHATVLDSMHALNAKPSE